MHIQFWFKMLFRNAEIFTKVYMEVPILVLNVILGKTTTTYISCVCVTLPLGHEWHS